MNLHTVSVLLLVLCCGGPFTRAVKLLEVKEGEDLKFKCSFYTSGAFRAFCKNHCELRYGFLVVTLSDLENYRKYSLEFEKRPSYPDLMHVTIRNVQRSDAGSYSCALITWTEDDRKLKWTFVDVDIYVTSAESSRPGVAEGPSASEAQQDHAPVSDVGLYVGLSLGALLILSVTLTVLYWRKRTRAAPESAQTPGCAQVLEVESRPEEVPPDSRKNREAPVETPSDSFSNPIYT